MIDPRLVQQTLDLMDKNPDAEIWDDPPGIVDAVMAEKARREQNAKMQSVIDDAPMAKPEPRTSDVNPLEFMNPKRPVGALAQGGLQGLSIGFSDEAMGAGEMFYKGLTDPSASLGDLGEAYTSGRDLAREDLHTAAKEQPGMTTAGMLIGGAASPVKAPLGGTAFQRGAQIGGMAGVGMNEDPSRLEEDVGSGAMLGGVLGVAGEKIGGGIAKAGQWLSKKADDLLTSVLGFSSDEVVLLKNQQPELYQEVLKVARKGADEAGFPYQSQPMREAIEGPAVTRMAAGSIKPTGGSVTGNILSEMQPYKNPNSWQKPMEPAERIVSNKLGTLADKSGGGILPKTGLTPTTLKGGLLSAAMAKTEMVGGIGIHKVGQKMIEMATNSDMAAGMSRSGTGKLVQLVDAVLSSDNPELEDYLAKEMSAEYNLLSKEARDALEKEQAGQ